MWGLTYAERERAYPADEAIVAAEIHPGCAKWPIARVLPVEDGYAYHHLGGALLHITDAR